MLKVLDLFSGIGGFSLGLERAGMETVAFCEIEEYPRSILKKHWPDVPIFKDVKALKGEELERKLGKIDVIAGGVPCQPFSVAGNQKGAEDDRHLWPEMFRLIQEIRPDWVIVENVAGFVKMALDSVLHDLESEGYASGSYIIPACAVNAAHKRDRIWIVATRSESGEEPSSHAKHDGSSALSVSCSDGASGDYNPEGKKRTGKPAGMDRSANAQSDAGCSTSPIESAPAHANSDVGRRERCAESFNGETRLESSCQGELFGEPGILHQSINLYAACSRPESIQTSNLNASNTDNTSVSSRNFRQKTQFIDTKIIRRGSGSGARISIEGSETQPEICATHDGFSGRVAMLKALGNAVVPQIPEQIGRAIAFIVHPKPRRRNKR